MQVLRGSSEVETSVRKLFSRIRGSAKVSRPEWPVVSAARPLFYLLRFFGLVPCEISEDYQVIPGSFEVIYSLFCVLVHTYAIYIVLNKPVLKRESIMLDIIENAKMVVNYCVTVFNIFIAVWTRKELITFLNILKYFDTRIHDLGHPRKERATKVWAWCTSFFTVFIWITVSRFGMVAFNEFWIDNVSYLLAYLANSLSTIKFSSIVLLLGQRFRHLNKIAKQSKEYTTNKQKYIAVDSKVIQHLHNILMNAGESLSSQYSWPLMFWLTNLCYHSVSNLYFLIDWIMATPQWAATPWALVNVLSWWLVTYIAQLLLLHITCHFTSAEANSMGSILINWTPFYASKNYRFECLLHLINRKLNFSAGGCFYVNLPLFRSITALLATYLVLLFQFQG